MPQNLDDSLTANITAWKLSDTVGAEDWLGLGPSFTTLCEKVVDAVNLDFLICEMGF